MDYIECCSCKRSLLEVNFYNDYTIKSLTGKRAECKTCTRIYYDDYKLRNPEKIREMWKKSVNKWRKRNKLRARELGRKHQETWRNKNPERNRLKAKYGMIKLKLKKQGLL